MICAKNYKTVSKFVKIMLEYCGLFLTGYGVVTSRHAWDQTDITPLLEA